MTTTLVAGERFYYNGRNVEKGEEFEAEDQDVMLLTHHHTPKAVVPEVTPQSKKKADKIPEPEAKPRTTYKRRDLRAEN